MEQFARRRSNIAVLSLLMVLVGAHYTSAQTAQQIASDPTLSLSEKLHRMQAVENKPSPLIAPAILLATGSLLLVGTLIVKRRNSPTSALRRDPIVKQSSQSPSKPAYKPAAVAAPAPNYPLQRQQPEPTVAKLPESQEDVEAIEPENRGVSFFTSRPLPFDALVDVTVVVGQREHIVLATAQEAGQVAAGQTPRVRAFTVDGQTLPWYVWEKYDPYRDYWTAVKREWNGFGNGAIACTITAESCPSRLSGYFASEDDDAAGAEAVDADRAVTAS
jgi:hypothetical protein